MQRQCGAPGAHLVHLAAQRGREALALERGLHLAARAEPQVVDAVERARHLHYIAPSEP